MPLPVAPALRVAIEESLLDADHVQPAAVVTVTLSVPPPEGKLALVGAIENVQPEPWLTVNVCPAIVSVPVRAGPLLADTV